MTLSTSSVRSSVRGKASRRKFIVAVLAVFLLAFLANPLAGHSYFVQELLSAELFLVLGISMLLVLGTLAYFVGSVCMRGLEAARSRLRRVGSRRAEVSPSSERFAENHSVIRSVHASSL